MVSIMEELEIEKTHESGELVAGLDIGTTKICVVIGEVFEMTGLISSGSARQLLRV